MKTKGSASPVSFALLTLLFAVSALWAEAGSAAGAPPPRRAIVATPVVAATTEHVVDVPLSSGAQQRVLYVAPASPEATIVMLPGGSGRIGLSPDGNLRHADNFVVRTRDMWAAQGYAVVIPDAIDHANLRGLRSSSDYASVVADLVRFAKAQAAVPVFLLGTSQGSIAAANGAAHAPPGTLAGVVMTESVSRFGGSHETVFDAGLENIRVPALVVANRDDRCPVAPPEDAAKIAAAMKQSPDVHAVEVSGGIAASAKACGSLSPHGYYGIEAQVVASIGDWLRGQLRPKGRGD